MSGLIAVDTSVAVPLLVTTHGLHGRIVRWWAGQPLALAGHALAETYSVLTRLPGDLRAPADVVSEVLEQRFSTPLVLSAAATRAVPRTLSALNITGGAVYDALVALAALEHDVPLATRDQRARATYEALGARVILAG